MLTSSEKTLREEILEPLTSHFDKTPSEYSLGLNNRWKNLCSSYLNPEGGEDTLRIDQLENGPSGDQGK